MNIKLIKYVDMIKGLAGYSLFFYRLPFYVYYVDLFLGNIINTLSFYSFLILILINKLHLILTKT